MENRMRSTEEVDSSLWEHDIYHILHFSPRLWSVERAWTGMYCFPFSLILLDSKLQWLLSDTLCLFDSVINSTWFLRTSIILFLTGIEEFKVKLFKVRYNLIHLPLLCVYLSRQVPLKNYYPGYTGGADVYKAARYILWRFMQTNRASLNVYPQ